MVSLCACAQDVVQLPVPEHPATLPVAEALAVRHSVREYAETPLNLQQISNVCWAACGVSRDAEHRTSPTAMNHKEIRLFAFTAEGVYEYLPVENQLALKAKGDHRGLVAGTASFSQDFVVTAPLSLVMVIDFDRFGTRDEHAVLMGCVDAGNVSENINLYCAAAGLCTVPRATMDAEGIRALLGLSDNQVPIMNNPVGLSK